MRVIAGRWGGRELARPAGSLVRPSQERVREGLFGHLAQQVAGRSVVDLYAGSGALGLEALSRGAARAIFVERERAALRVLRENLERLGIGREAVVIGAPVERFLAGRYGRWGPIGLLVADPPYGTIDDRWIARVASSRAIEWGPDALWAWESSGREAQPEAAPGWRRLWQRGYGETRVTMYGRESQDE